MDKYMYACKAIYNNTIIKRKQWSAIDASLNLMQARISIKT